jgi:oligopeptide/dipeptide ABC transporter ATP-binding protein
MSAPVLSVRDLVIEFDTVDGVVHAVNGVTFEVYPEQTLGIVGESGSGKTVTALSILGLIPQPPGRIVAGEILYDGLDLLRLGQAELRRLRGKDLTMVFQDLAACMNPVLTVGYQIAEALEAHDPALSRRAARTRVIELLELVGIPEARARADQYPHEFSGGMCQRAMIAMAIANQPRLLVADEPTTALDVTIQAQIVDVLRTAQHQTRAATVLITHDLGLIAELADRVIVMYAGRVVEVGDVFQIFGSPRHPYTVGLMSSRPRPDIDLERLCPIDGLPPSLIDLPPGCVFHPRCGLSAGRERCREIVPALTQTSHDQSSACHFHTEVPSMRARIETEIGLMDATGAEGGESDRSRRR